MSCPKFQCEYNLLLKTNYSIVIIYSLEIRKEENRSKDIMKDSES